MYIKKKTWTITFVYVLPGIGKHHCYHIRVKAHAIGVSIRAFYSCVFFNFLPKFEEQDFKRTLSDYMSLCIIRS